MSTVRIRVKHISKAAVRFSCILAVPMVAITVAMPDSPLRTFIVGALAGAGAIALIIVVLLICEYSGPGEPFEK